jgi:YegS/Rv2252/BmrU family lipid kinase
MKHILFIINPVSGTKRKEELVELIQTVFKSTKTVYEIKFTQYAGHAKEIANIAVEEGFDCIVAVGGDGTVNEVGSALAGTNCLLGIIPFGSGNGLARSLHISMNPRHALSQLLQASFIEIDTLSLNELFFVNIAGVGFDAKVAHAFLHQKKRGLLSYIKAALSMFYQYKGININYNHEGKWYRKEVFLMSFANSGQYGNNAYIAPKANLRDGLMDISILKPFPFYAAPGVAFSLLTKNLHKQKYYEGFKAKAIDVETSGEEQIHIDGEAIQSGSIIKVKVQDKKLKVICNM